MRAICDELDEYVLLPAQSPHLSIEKAEETITAIFNGERMQFLASDTLLLPIRNTTVEEFAHMLLLMLVEKDDFFAVNDVRRMIIKVSSGDGQWGSSVWDAEEKTP